MQVLKLISTADKFVLFPNPNHGIMTLDYLITKDAVLEVYQINGILVDKYNLSSSNNRLEIGNRNLDEGIYLYKIIENNTILKSGKIVIIK